ncbi:ABC transporter substrate-binding protein [Plastoroseomonas hellenica]|uniref:ABC transporter substrate-binding protein n=1 Tax=Plastoroseomonas hellenica TaxID=2687306 RepID=UPI001BA9B51D|nr:ABC transporter substrate-binding protein [Plastoroseomonas hellenica]MBR0645701.1 ABC transporter substrate-binding protein [Plastoroseomonas hellenica]
MSSNFGRRGLLAAAALLPGAAMPARPALAQAGRVLRVVPHGNLALLDPIVTTTSMTNGHAYHVFDVLFALDSQYQPRPQMAAGHTVSADRLSWEITLRPGLRFHDGEPVLARDCAASLNRWAARDSTGQMIAGISEEPWSAADDRTIRLRLKRPFPRLLFALAKAGAMTPFMMPERLARTSPNTPLTEMVGSGPFRFLKDEFVTGTRAAYARFEGYVPRDEPSSYFAGGKHVHSDRIEWHIIPDGTTAAAAITRGEMDWWEAVAPDVVPLLRRSRGVTVDTADALGYVSFIRFNHLIPPFNNLALRRALMLAINQADYMQAANGEHARWQSCMAMYPCGAPQVNEIGKAFMPATPDLARARDAIRAAGYAGERVVILNPTDYPTLAPLGEVSADLMKRLGFNVDLQAMDQGTVLQRRLSKAPLDAGGWNMFHTWAHGLGMRDPLLNVFIQGQGESGWPGWYSDPKLQQLVEDWTYANDAAQSQRLLDAIQTQAFEGLPIIPLGQWYGIAAYRSNLQGVIPATNALPWNVRRV